MKNVIQRISHKKKISDNNAWGKENIDMILDNFGSNWARTGSQVVDWRLNMMDRSYKMYNSDINNSDFENDLNPTGIDVGQKQDLIMPYNKMHNKINVLLGELAKRPFNIRAYLMGAEGAQALEDQKRELLRTYMIGMLEMQIRQKQIQESGGTREEIQSQLEALQQEYADLIPPNQIDEYLSKEYLEPREILANKLLNILLHSDNISEKRIDSFKHGLLADEEHCWVGVDGGKVKIHVLNPMNVIYQKSPDVKYIQHGEFAGYRTFMSIADVLDSYRNLKPEDVKKLEERLATIGTRNTGSFGDKEMNYNFAHLELESYKTIYGQEYGQYGYSFGNEVEVGHVEWRSQQKLYVVTMLDPETGEPIKEFVNEDVVINKEDPNFISVETIWVPQVWEGTRIDLDIYTDIRPVLYQYVDPDNPYVQPLRYHGVIYNNTNARSVSTAERMYPFQMLFYLVMHKMKRKIARDKGKKFALDVTRVDPSIGLEKTLYYLDEMDIFLYNSLEGGDQPGSGQRPGIENSIAMSTLDEIMGYIQVLEYIDMQIGEVAGVTKPREGQTTAYEAVTNAQQSILQSTNITEILYNSHYLHWEHALNTAVNLMLRLYNEKGFLGQIVGKDFKREYINVDPNTLPNSSFNLFVQDAAKENDIFNQLKALAQPLLQNDKARFSDIIKLLKATSIEELSRDIDSFEKEFEARQQQMQEAERQNQLQIQKMQMEQEDKKMAFEEKLNTDDNKTKIMVAQIQSFSRQQDQDKNANGVPDQLEITKLNMEAAQFMEELNLEEKKLAQEKELTEKDQELKEKEIEVKKIASKKKPASK